MSNNKAVDRFYHEGRKSFSAVEKCGKYYHSAANPYSMDSFRGKEWQRGYNLSYFQNLKRIQAR